MRSDVMARPRPTAHPVQRPYSERHGGRLRVLVETADRTLLISDFRCLLDAGFDVATCAGPDHDSSRCPLLRGEQCELVAQSDVVVHALDPTLQIATAIKTAHPDLPVLVQRRRRQDGTPVPEGCVPLDMPCSVGGQLEAIRRTVGRRLDLRVASATPDSSARGRRPLS